MAPELNLDGWTVEQKLELIGQIWNSIPDTPAALPIPEWHRQVLEQCIAEDDANPDSGTPWEEVKAQLDAEL